MEDLYRDAELYNIFEGTSEIQRMVISNALGAAVGSPPLQVVLEPSGGPINRVFGRGTPLRSRAADSAPSIKDRVPEPVMLAGHEGAATAGWVSGSRYRRITPTTKAGR